MKLKKRLDEMMASTLVRCDDPRYLAFQDPPSEANYLDILAACQSFTSKILRHAACSGFAVAESNENVVILDEKKFIMFQSTDAEIPNGPSKHFFDAFLCNAVVFVAYHISILSLLRYLNVTATQQLISSNLSNLA